MGWEIAAIIDIFEFGWFIKHRRHAGACKDMLSQQFWWHHTALLPNSGNSSKNALGADMFLNE